MEAALALLELGPESTPADWKRAYRRLAMRWHPDRCDHPEATERFKAIAAAYDTLLAAQAEERAEGDAEPEAATPEPDTPPSPAPAPPPMPDIRLSLTLSLEEAAAGCRKTLRVTRHTSCETCDGSGESGLSRTRFCEDCHGSGRLHDRERGLVHCPACAGKGLFTERRCPACEGSGQLPSEVDLVVRIPPGLLPGDDLRLAGQGQAAQGDRPAGDAYVTILLAAHPAFERHGRDLHRVVPVSALSLLAGGEIEIPGLLGLQSHTLSPGTVAPRTLCLKGAGYPGRGGQPAGDLHVRCEPVYPASLDAASRKRLLALDAALIAQGAYPDLINEAGGAEGGAA